MRTLFVLFISSTLIGISIKCAVASGIGQADVRVPGGDDSVYAKLSHCVEAREAMAEIGAYNRSFYMPEEYDDGISHRRVSEINIFGNPIPIPEVDFSSYSVSILDLSIVLKLRSEEGTTFTLTASADDEWVEGLATPESLVLENAEAGNIVLRSMFHFLPSDLKCTEGSIDRDSQLISVLERKSVAGSSKHGWQVSSVLEIAGQGRDGFIMRLSDFDAGVGQWWAEFVQRGVFYRWKLEFEEPVESDLHDAAYSIVFDWDVEAIDRSRWKDLLCLLRRSTGSDQKRVYSGVLDP